MKNKSKKKQAHLKSKKNRALKRKRASRSFASRGNGLRSSFINKLKKFEFDYAVENMAEVSFAYLEKGTNYYLNSEDVGLTLDDFLTNRRADICFSCGVRGVIKDGNLRVSKPLTWVPEKDNPTVKNYLAELWNKTEEEKGTFQILSFSFFLYDDDDFDGDTYGDTFLSCCVMVSGASRDEINGYLVMRQVGEKDGELSLEGKNIFVDTSEVLDIIVPPMFNSQGAMTDDVAEEIGKDFCPAEEGEGDE